MKSFFLLSGIQKLEFIGLLIAFVGLCAQFADLKGAFLDQDKVHIADLVWNSEGGIPRETRGFEKFLKDFPPPKGVPESSVTHLVKNKLQMEPSFVMSGAVRYLADGHRSEPVASFEDVRRWSVQNNYAWISWAITLIGFLIAAGGKTLELIKGKI